MAVEIEFIIVKVNKPVEENCAACGMLILDREYTRDWPTRIVYHNRWCRQLHIDSTRKAIEHVAHAGKTSSG
jgi:hypothetical protein